MNDDGIIVFIIFIIAICSCLIYLEHKSNNLLKRVTALEKFTASQIHSNSQERAIERILAAEDASKLEE